MTFLFSIGAFLVGGLILWVVCKLLRISVKILWKLLVNAAAGALFLLVFNFVGGLFGLGISLTPLNALVAGIFGIPGVILLLLFA